MLALEVTWNLLPESEGSVCVCVCVYVCVLASWYPPTPRNYFKGKFTQWTRKGCNVAWNTQYLCLLIWSGASAEALALACLIRDCTLEKDAIAFPPKDRHHPNQTKSEFWNKSQAFAATALEWPAFRTEYRLHTEQELNSKGKLSFTADRWHSVHTIETWQQQGRGGGGVAENERYKTKNATTTKKADAKVEARAEP